MNLYLKVNKRFISSFSVSKILTVCLIAVACLVTQVKAQKAVDADMSMIDGVELNRENILNYRIFNNSNIPLQLEVSGRVQYRRLGLNFGYKYKLTVQPGITMVSKDIVQNLSWNFSETALRELFFEYNKLPQGTYEYCVSIKAKGGALDQNESSEPIACVYHTVEDLFLINLVTPENDAKIYEYNPMLAWVVNYPFANELSYKLRVAELKEGQNPQNAITRNNPMYKDDHVMTTGTVYPVAAKPLQKWQPYVWTVDAYYKGILLGGAEVWKFTIVDDSELMAVPKDMSYYEFEKHQGDTRLFAVGKLKLKYISDLNADTLSVKILNSSGNEVGPRETLFPLVLGDNRIFFEIFDRINLKHKEKYTLVLTRGDRKTFLVPFTYINPLYIK